MDCHHEDLYVKTLGRRVSARFCSIFPVVNVGGGIKHLQLTANELTTYQAELVALLKRYVKRIAWLLSKSHRIFGLVTHKRVVLLIDTSGESRGSREVDEVREYMGFVCMWERWFMLSW